MLRTLLLAAAAASTLLIAGQDDIFARGCRGGSSCGGGGLFSGGRGHQRGGCGGGGCASSGCASSACGGGGCSQGGCGGMVAGCGGCGGGVVAPGMMAPPPPSGPAPKGEKVAAPFEQTIATNKATIVVSLPADATLSVDGHATTSTSSLRVFRTPALESGSDFYYTLRAEVVRDGRSESIVRQVAVRAGVQTRVELSLPVTTVAVNN